MDSLVSTQFEQMCRACLSCNEDVRQSLFDYVEDFQNKRVQIYELLNSTVQNLPKIEIMDALPKNLCTRCVEKLCAFYEFQYCCINSDLHLRRLIVSSMIQGAETNSTDPLQNDLTQFEEFIKLEIVEKEGELIKHEICNANDDLKKGNRASADIEYENDDVHMENEAIECNNSEDPDTLNCKICGTEFLYKRNLARHLKRSHDIVDAKNTNKSKTLRTKIDDSDDSEEEQQWTCDICEKTYKHKKTLQKHKKRVHAIKSSVKEATEALAVQEEYSNQENVATEKQFGKIGGNEEDNADIGSTNWTTNEDGPMKAAKSDVERVYLCEICETEFSYKKNLKRHMKRAHDFEWPTDILMESDAPEPSVLKKAKKDNRTWTCEICKTKFLYKRNLRRHMKRTHNEESPIEIKTGIIIIPPVVKSESQFRDSESSAEEWDIPKICIWTCERCQKKFTLKKNLVRHMKNFHKDELLNKELKTEVDAENTLNTSQAELFKCNECDSVFSKKVYLRKHKYRHRQPGGLKRETKTCDICGLLCKTLPILKEHYSSVHPDRLEADSKQLLEPFKFYVCQYCNKSFQQSCTLKDHLRVHTKEQPFLCSQCGKAFNSISNLRQHVLRHDTEKRYECPHCPKKFPCSSDLASHKRMHMQLKSHVCDICNAAFGKPYQLKTHKKYHNGEKRYQCEYCAKRFVCGDHLRRHIRSHTGEKPYKCKYCPRSFSQSNDMIKHLRSHLGENVYQCELCPAAFRLASELRTHFALHKNDDEETQKRNKLAWHEAQEQLKLKLESERPTHSRTKKTPIASDNLPPQDDDFLLL